MCCSDAVHDANAAELTARTLQSKDQGSRAQEEKQSNFGGMGCHFLVAVGLTWRSWFASAPLLSDNRTDSSQTGSSAHVDKGPAFKGLLIKAFGNTPGVRSIRIRSVSSLSSSTHVMTHKPR